MQSEVEGLSESESDLAYLTAFISNAVPILTLLLATTVLYRGRDIFLPLTTAVILAVIFTQIANLIEPFFGRIFSAVLVVVLAIGTLSATGYFLTAELTAVADKVAGYSSNIGSKLGALEKLSPPWLRHLKYALSDIEQRTQAKKTASAATHVFQAMPASPPVLDQLRPVAPVIDGVVEALLITVLLFFLLYSRKDLRDRLVRLIARGHIVVAPQAIEAAARTVSRYLLFFSLTNLGFGLACGVSAWLLGLPSAALWGLLAFLFRFVPYVGAMIAATLPALLAFALFPGWAKSFEIIGSFLLFDQIAGQFIEPFVVGPGIDVSPVALLISAMYWSWLWGMPGLLLATPLTACLKVAGDYIPALDFLSVLLGANRKLADYHDFYRLLLEQDHDSAQELGTHYADKYGLERTFDDVLAPVLELAGEERLANHINDEMQQSGIRTIRELIEDLGDRHAKRRGPNRLRVAGICAPGEVHSLGLLMILELLRHAGAAIRLVEDAASSEELRLAVGKFAPQLICLSCTTAECVPSALELVACLKKDSPGVPIFAGGTSAAENVDQMLAAGCEEVCSSREEARRALRQFAVRHARSPGTGNRPLRA